MRRLRDTIAVSCPIDQAPARIERFFDGRRDDDGKVRLHMPLDREVFVEARTSCDGPGHNYPIRVSWESDSDVRLPSFAGTLTTWAERNPEITFIELDGTYDDTLDRKKAQRTAKELLAQIAAAVADALGMSSP
jgi:hypothetical protein